MMKKSGKKYSFKARLLGAVLALSLAAGLVPAALAEAAPTNAPAVTEAPAEATVAPAEATEAPAEAEAAAAPAEAGRKAFLPGDKAGHPVTSMEEAVKVVASLHKELAADENTQFEPWRTLKDTAGNVYYVFRQMYAQTTVSGGAVKIVTDPQGKMLGAVSSVETELPSAEQSQGISAQEAEKIVLEHEKARLGRDAELQQGKTEKVILPVNRDLDPFAQEAKEESRFVWAVYTTHTEGSVARGSDLPFLAHYVTMQGEYLYSLPTLMPGDAAATSGYDAAYMFQFMESVPYTGTVTMPDGTEQEITVDVMRDTRTGMYYLGNLERRMVVADCYPFLYEQGTVKLEASADNTGWDETCLMSLYNYCRAWDYYAAIGWMGGDGEGTPIMILKEFCDAKHNPVNNAAYAGKYYGWQVFLSSSANQFSKALDVLAHEFTHCVTGSVMTYNAYLNDYGAINEAMSDIQGNICEMMAGATEDTTWKLGENGGMVVRSMSDPHAFAQPEYTWDYYYQPHVKTPSDVNDRGGVHTNSSLLNRTAYLLCEQGGMTLEEARAFWFAVDLSMVPGTDYAQLAELLPWVMQNIGMEKYLPALQEIIGQTGISSNALPETIPEDRAMLRLTLPEMDIFTDGSWLMYALSVDPDGVTARLKDIWEGKNGAENALKELMDAFMPPEPPKEQKEEKGLLESLLDIFTSKDEEKAPAEPEPTAEPTPVPEEPKEESDALTRRLMAWLTKYFGETAFITSASAGQDGRTIRMMCRPGVTVPLLMHMKLKKEAMEPETIDFAVYLFGHWIEMGSLTGELDANFANLPEAEQQKALENSNVGKLVNSILDGMTQEDPRPFLDRVFLHTQGGQVCEIPSAGLENARLMDADLLKELEEAGADPAAEPGTEAAADPAAETTAEPAAEPSAEPAGETGVNVTVEAGAELTVEVTVGPTVQP